MQSTIKLPLVKELHIVVAKNLSAFLGLQAQSAYTKDVPFDVASKPPRPQIKTPAEYDSGCADGERSLVAIICPLLLE